MRRSILPRSLDWLLTALVLTDTVAVAALAYWTTLANCQLQPNPAHDGDSFHVRCNGREYIFRLYFVDALETDNSVPDRVAQQAAYFGISKPSAQNRRDRQAVFSGETQFGRLR